MKLFFGIWLGIVCGSVTVYAAYKYVASDVSFTPSDEGWNVKNVEEALNNLYSRKKASNPVLVGSGNISYNSSVTTLSNVPANLSEVGSNYLSLENNIFTVKEDGYYIIYCAVGSNMNRLTDVSYSGYVQIEVNGSVSVYAYQSYDIYTINHIILKLSAGDTIIGKYRADGGNFTKRAEYKVFYAG